MAEGGVEENKTNECFKIRYILSVGHEVGTDQGEVTVSLLSGLTFSGYIDRQVSLDSLRWVSYEQYSSFPHPPNRCIVVSYLDLTTLEDQQIFFESDLAHDDDSCLNAIKELIGVKYQTCSDKVGEVQEAVEVISHQPIFMGKMKIHVHKGEYVVANIVHEEGSGTEHLAIIDLETVSLYANELDRPVYQLHFWKDEDPTSIEKVKLTRTEQMGGAAESTVSLQTQTHSFTFKSVGEIVKQLQNLIPKEKHVLAYPKLLLQVLPELTVKAAETFQRRKPHWQLEGRERAGASNMIGSGFSEWDAPSQASGTDSTSTKALEIKTQLETAEVTFRENEDMQNIWVTIECDITEMINSGEVPSTDHRSGGLDADSGDHLAKAFSDVEDQFRENNIGVAVSRLQACRELFSTSSNAAIRSVFDMSDTQLLKALYFKSLC